MSFNTFTGTQPNEADLAAIQAMAEKYKREQDYVNKQNLALIELKKAALKGETEIEQRSRKLREARERFIKDIEDKEIADYEKKLKRDKEIKEREEKLQKLEDENYKNEKTNVEKLKKSPILDLLPDGVKKIKINEKTEENGKKDDMFFKLSEVFKNLPNNINNLFGKINKQNDTGEQKNIGEQILRVSFHPEGIKILRTLLDPIYKSLSSFTENMDKGIASIIKNIKDSFKGGGSGWLASILLLALADIVWMGEKLYKIYQSVKGMVITIGEIFTKIGKQLEQVGVALKRFLIDPFVKIGEKLGINKWIDETIKATTEGITKFKNGVLDEISKFKNSFFEKLGFEKNFAKLTTAQNAYGESLVKTEGMYARMSNALKTSWQTITDLRTRVSGWFTNISNMFKEEGPLSNVSKFVKNLGEQLTKIKGPIQGFFEFFSPLGKVLEMFIAPLKWLARFISIPVIQLIDGFVTGIKTFFSVINDDALGPIQKATAVIAGFFGGLGSLISELVSFFGTLLGWVGKIPTLGWVGKIGEAVDWVAEKIDTHKLGEQTIDLMKTYNDGQAMGPEDNRTPQEIWRSSPKYQQASPEERKVLDERYSKALMPNKEKEPKITPVITPVGPVMPAPSVKYEPKPEENSNQVVAQNVALSQDNKKIITSLDNLTATLQKNSEKQNNTQSTTVINQTQQSPSSNTGIKDYLLKPVRDVNFETRMTYTNNSNNRNWGYI